MNLSIASLDEWYSTHEHELLEDFFSFLRFKGISTDPSHKQDCLDTAHFLVDYLSKIGMESSLFQNPGLPVVFAEHKAGEDKPSVLIYQHYDVQPVDPIDLWDSDPFSPLIKDGKIYARGASDNKGQCFASLMALKAVLEAFPDFPLNIKLFIEGEEESGGSGTAVTLNEKRALLKADYLLVVDFDIPRENTPGITLGMRGITTLNVECQNARQDLHSGVHGGVALNPIRALTEVIAKLWDENGTIAIPHFYEDITPFSPIELEKVNLSFDKESYIKDFEVKAFCNEKGKSLKESNWLRPSLEINGICGGYTGIGFKTVIPAKAYAKISCRIVPGQNPQKVEQDITHFLENNIAKGVDIRIEPHHSASAFRTSPHAKIVQVVAQSQREVFGVAPEYTLCGASVPIVASLSEVTGAEVALFGTSLSTDNFHSPNEHFAIHRLKQGFMTMARILCHLAEVN
ncbi:MAG: M20/M25/M40 family metallo-hydrolase [Chlamydiae bacterium]|nr:M20/M25/M40 family metallo-hydrolase [Chlamydiota bacterium]